MSRSRQRLLLGIAFAVLASCGGDGFSPKEYDGGAKETDADVFAPPSGWLSATSDINGISGTGSTATAGFVHGSFGCAAVAIGPCTTVCPLSTGPYDSAGKITFSSGTQSISVMPDDSGKYQSFGDGMNALWSDGQMLSVVAAGSKVPAFNAKLTVPSVVTISQPAAAPATQKLGVPRGSGLSFSWTGGGSGDVTVLLSSSGTTLSCSFPSALGTGMVPANALAQLSPGDGGCAVSVTTHTEVTAGNYQVHVTASSHAVTTAGGYYSFPASFQ